MTITPVEVLMIEDSPSDIALALEAFAQSKVINHITVIDDGGEALPYLRRQNNHSDAIKPDLILLDLNLPNKDGRQILQEIREDPDLKHIPIVILTTSDDETDVLHAYQLAANCFITKPLDFQKFLNVAKQIEDFWFAVVRLPER